MKQWFVDLWNDYLDWCLEVLKEILLLIKDLSLDIFELMVNGVVFAIGLITPPEFLANGVNTLVAAIPPSIIYFLGQSGLSEGLAIYGSGIMFRLARKIYTLGQW
jgi:hypothetical protein